MTESDKQAVVDRPNQPDRADNHIVVRLQGGPHDGKVTGIVGEDLNIPAFLNFREERLEHFDFPVTWGYSVYQVGLVELGNGHMRYVAQFKGRVRHVDPVLPVDAVATPADR